MRLGALGCVPRVGGYGLHPEDHESQDGKVGEGVWPESQAKGMGSQHGLADGAQRGREGGLEQSIWSSGQGPSAEEMVAAISSGHVGSALLADESEVMPTSAQDAPVAPRAGGEKP